MKFNINYFIAAMLLLLIEILIGSFMHDALIRPYGGDFLVVILLYCLVKSISDTPLIKTAISVLLFSYLVEIAQYFHLAAILGLQHSRIALLLLGSSFSFTDILCYTFGIALVIAIEKIRIGLKISFN
jgi:DNA integrity scanning protein DisA with diadenylate cyclase activity